ncbi:DUF1617 family protein [Salipaludibacillus sp. CF4.18]|uniref:DUF1617 family protein n=1 Tax=Salipaludibacillus sp. CF4.18 TaxID=3373081 RepID=UPI003EE5BF2B
MIVKLDNGKLKQAGSLLFNLSLKGKQSRHRTKFINLMDERLVEIAEQEKELLKEHCHLDEEGEPKIKIDNGQKLWDVKDIDAFSKDKRELYEEQLVVDGGDSQGMLKTIKSVLLECDKEWQGKEALTYDYLCDQFEKESDK